MFMYDYVRNLSLDHALHSEVNMLLSWGMRLKICNSRRYKVIISSLLESLINMCLSLYFFCHSILSVKAKNKFVVIK
ncbi:hypothetical protein HanIR_Chr04g0185891 [Helianthus annuus]|nr:hypothetical protein HanIR_Chr04g0185891 [Helianthus annuus]